MNKKKTSTALILGLAGIWFTTHFGGGFASGAQMYSYYVRFGIWALIMPALAMAYNAVFYIYAFRYARKHELYDYGSYNRSFYGKYSPIFSTLFEVLYITVMCVAPAVAFATGGSTLENLTHLPYWVCTAIIGIFIFVIAMYGTDIVRKVSSVLSICIIAGLAIVVIPNIISNWGAISQNLGQMASQPASFGSALYSAFIYGTFQLCNVAVFVQHAKSLETPDDARPSMIIGAVVNALFMILVCLGLIGVYNLEGYADAKVPTLFMVENGVGAGFMKPMISVLIILGAVSTAVNMVAAMTKRVSTVIMSEQERAAEAKSGKPSVKTMIVALIVTLADFGIAQFGLIPLIAKGYSFIAYLAIPVILIPYIIHMIVTRWDTK